MSQLPSWILGFACPTSFPWIGASQATHGLFFGFCLSTKSIMWIRKKSINVKIMYMSSFFIWVCDQLQYVGKLKTVHKLLFRVQFFFFIKKKYKLLNINVSVLLKIFNNYTSHVILIRWYVYCQSFKHITTSNISFFNLLLLLTEQCHFH